MGKGCELAARKLGGVSRGRTGLSFEALEDVDLGVTLPSQASLGEARVADFHRRGKAVAAFRRSEVKSERKRWHEDKAQPRGEPDVGAARERLASHLAVSHPALSMIVTRSHTASQRNGARGGGAVVLRKSRREEGVGGFPSSAASFTR
ncbi:hypothetical protein T484DRAFT_1750066 [Baffinella frigidus]|nr:hypothetical protein T484DRAFT_1750066 [Cryptophyta sp. CCMP2293]